MSDTLGLKPVPMPELSVCSGCLGPRRWEFHYKCDGLGCFLFKQDPHANYYADHYHYRCRNCGRSITSRTQYPDI